MSWRKRIIAYTAASIMIIAALLESAETVTIGTAGAALGANLQEQKKEPLLVERGTNYDTYLLKDGLRECIVYSEDRYYLTEDNTFREIDRTIVRTSARCSEYGECYTTSGDKNKIFFLDGADTGTVYQANGAELKMSFCGSFGNAFAGGSRSFQEIAGIPLTGNNYLVYEDIWERTEVVYALFVNQLKEYIVLLDEDSPQSFSFLYDTSEMKVEMTAEKTIRFLNAAGKGCFELGRLFAIDTDGAYTENVDYELELYENRAIITIHIDEEYLNSPERVWPVVVDPSVTVTGENETYDTFVSSKYPTSNFYLNNYLGIGRNSTYYTMRTYIKVGIPGNVAPGSVSNAYISLKKNNGVAPNCVVRRVTGAWTSSELTWDDMPDATMTNQSTLTAGNSDWYNADITGILNGWLNCSYENYGLLIMSISESGTSNWTQFCSSDYSANKPELHITYSYQPMPVNRGQSLYSWSESYRNSFANVQNCYGYMLQTYCMDNVTEWKQDPGQFAGLETIDALKTNIKAALVSGGMIAINAILSRVSADFFAMNTLEDPWIIDTTPVSLPVSLLNGERLIAIAIRSM